MRAMPAGLQAHLDSGATTLCWCWRLTPRHGDVLGFTDHDRDLDFDGTTFEAATGFTASEIRESVGLSVDNLEVTSALVSSRLDETRLAAGDFDDAGVEIFRVNWQAPAQRILMRKGSIGEVRRGPAAFVAEVRGLSHYLQQPKGRLIQFTCDADLGDARCGIDLSSPLFAADGTIAAVTSQRAFTVSGIGSYEAGWFARGIATFTTGANAGRRAEIKRHVVDGAAHAIELWQPMLGSIAAGNGIRLTSGCDKQPDTCATRFANLVRYRGFPHIPGNDFVTGYARPGDATSTSVSA